MRGLKAAALVDGDVDDDRARVHQAEHLARDKPWRECSGYENGADDNVGLAQRILDDDRVGHQDPCPRAEVLVELVQAIERPLQDLRHPPPRLRG